MRVLLPGPAGPDTFADNVAATLKLMGHEPIAVSSRFAGTRMRQMIAAFTPIRDRVLRQWAPSFHDRQLLARVRDLRPELVLFLTWNVHPEILAEIRKISRAVLWWADSPANAYRTTLVDHGWHKIYLKDVDAVRKIRGIGIDAELMHEAMNPTWHRPVAVRAGDQVAVAGNYYSYRQAMCSRLLAGGVSLALYGPRPPLWAPAEIREAWTGRYIVREEKSRLFGEALACLNSFSFAEGNSLNCRAFEIAGAGGLQLIEYRPAIEECFVPGEELAIFRGEDELLALIERARSDHHWAHRLRANGAERARRDHTYAHRLKVILRA
jgi:spore maturation protein CgeB